MNLFTGSIPFVSIESYDFHETKQLQDIIYYFEKDSILVMDRGFSSRATMKLCLENGLNFICRVKSGKTALREFKLFSESRESVKIIKLKEGRDFSGSTITVKLIKAGLDKQGNPIVIATNLLDEIKYPGVDLANIYRDRWAIETLFDRLKNVMNLPAFHAKDINGIFQEIYTGIFAVMAAYSFNISVNNEMKQDCNSVVHHNKCKYKSSVKKSIYFTLKYLKFFISNLLKFIDKDGIVEHIETLMKKSVYKFRPNRFFSRFSKAPRKRWRELKRSEYIKKYS